MTYTSRFDTLILVSYTFKHGKPHKSTRNRQSP
jgi:hypothetical protein